MKKNMALYPVINGELFNKLEFTLNTLEASYIDPSVANKKKLKLEKVESDYSRISVFDDAGRWNPKDYDISISGEFEIAHTEVLFGKGGVAERKSVLGIGLEWKSKPSNLRGAMELTTIDASSKSQKIKFRKPFRNSVLRTSVELSIIVYVKDAGKGNDNIFAKIGGSVLGEIFSTVVVLEGVGSAFTVFEKEDPSDVLWKIECDWEDPATSLFSDAVKIIINNAHPARKTSQNNPALESEFLKEIMASSICIIINKLEEREYNGSEDYELGSVSAAMNYLLRTADLDVSTPERIAVSIRQYLDKVMK